MLECVVNIAEGRDHATIEALTVAAGECLLDVHVDAVTPSIGVHARRRQRRNRDACDLAKSAVSRIDLTHHQGAHPRLGVVDVVPFVPLGPDGMKTAGDLSEAIRARDKFCAWAAAELSLPCFTYGPERTLPDVRKHAFSSLSPQCGPGEPHPTAGASCVGARPVLVAYNLLLADASIEVANEVARAIRSAEVRALAFAVADGLQVSCNLIAPWNVGPGDVFDRVAAFAPIRAAELVGLIPAAVLHAVDKARWEELGMSDGATIESRLAASCAPGPATKRPPAARATRWRRMRRRSRSLIPPQIPNFSLLAMANSRQSSRTTHPRHTSFASRVEDPRSGKNKSGSTPRQFALDCHELGCSPSRASTSTEPPLRLRHSSESQP